MHAPSVSCLYITANPRFANHKKNGLWTLSRWYLHKLFLHIPLEQMTSHFVPFLDKLRNISFTKNDFPVPACPVMNTLCPLSTTSSTSLWSTVSLQCGITHETDPFFSTYTPPPPPSKNVYSRVPRGRLERFQRGGLLTLNMLSGVWFYLTFVLRFTWI